MLLSSNVTGAFILIATGSLFAMLVFFFLLFRQYVGRKMEHAKQLEQLKIEHEQILLQSQLEIQENTLRSISHEVHDNIGQVLSLVALNLSTMEILTGEQSKLHKTVDLVQRAIEDLRHLSKALLPERVQKMGLCEAVLADALYIENTGKYVVKVEVSENFPDFTPNETVIVYRIVQELLNNAIKHAKADKIFIKLLFKNNVATISVEDNGSGFEASGQQGAGIGLNTIAYRASILKAKLDIRSIVGEGTTVSIIFHQS